MDNNLIMLDSLTQKSQTRIIAIANQKGGVGKTTTAVNVATAMAATDKRVLLIDLDPQGNASTSVGIDKSTAPSNSYQVLFGARSVGSAALSTKIPNLFVIPSSKNLLGVDLELSTIGDNQFYLKRAIEAEVKPFDFIIIDCPPAVGLLTVNALVAAHAVMMPIQCEYLALEGVADLVKTIERIRKNFNPKLEIQGIVLTMFDSRNKLAGLVADDVRGFFGKKVYDTVIPRNVRVSEAPSHGKPVILYDMRCSGAVAYINLASEVLKREKELAA